MFFDLPGKQKISVNIEHVYKSGVGGMPTILSVNFGVEVSRGPESLEKQGRKIAAGKLTEEFPEKFAGNFLKIRQTKIE